MDESIKQLETLRDAFLRQAELINDDPSDPIYNQHLGKAAGVDAVLKYLKGEHTLSSVLVCP